MIQIVFKKYQYYKRINPEEDENLRNIWKRK